MVNQGIQAVSTIGLGIATGGQSLGYQGAIWLGGKIIDKATGNRSRLQKFIEANIDGEGFPEPTGKVDLRIQQEIDRRTKENKDNADRLNKGVTKLELAQQKIKDKDTSEMLYDAKVPPDFGTVGDENHNISPAGMMWSRLELANIVNGKYEPIFGKTPEGFDQATAVIDKAIDLTLQKYPDTFTKIAAEYKEKRRSGGRIGKEGTQEYANFLTAVKSERDQSSDQIPNSAKIPVAEDTTPTTPTLSTRQQMGKDENLAFLTKLKTTAKALPVSEVDIIEKAKLLGAMEQLGMNLGRGDRVNTALEIAAKAERDGVRQELIAEYLMPYIQRVEQQQNAQQVDNVSEIDESTSKNILVPIEEVSFQNNPMRVSPSRTEGAKKKADSFNTDRQISLDIIKSDPAVLNKISTKLQDKSVYSGIISNAKDDGEYLEDFVTHAKDNLIALHNGVSPVFRERAKQWYVGANTITRNIADKYEIPEHAAAGVYAALSPQKDWYMNQELGHRVIDIHTTQMNAGRVGSNQPQVVFDDKMKNAMLLWMHDPKKKTSKKAMAAYEEAFKQLDGKSYVELPNALKAYWLRFYDESYNDKKGHRVITPEGGFGDLVLTSRGNVAGTGWNSFRDIRKGIEILLDSSRENIDRQLGEKHKVRSFYNNILDPMATAKDTTIDTHAVAAALLQPLSGKSKAVLQNFKDGGTSKSIGVFGSYGVYHEAYVRAAEELGLLPRELQSITWEAVRGLFSPAFKGQKANVEAIENIWKDYELGGISLEETRSRIYETAGGISPAAWEDNASRQRDGINESTRINPNAGALASIARSPSSEGDGRGATSGSPRVLPQPTKKLAPTNPIDVTQAKPFVRDAQSLMSIGKEGGRYENGIEIGDAYNLMDALNIVYRGVSSIGAMSDAVKKTGKKRVNEDAEIPMGFYRGNSTGTGGQVVALRQGTVKKDGTKVIPIEELVILFHEIAHGLENQVLNRELKTFKEVKNPLNGKMNFVRNGTFREHLFNHIMDDKGDAVIDEIMNLQTNIDIYQEANPSETYAVRPIREMYATGMKNFDTAMLQLVTESQPDVELTPESLKRWRTSDGYKEQQRKASKFVGEEISDFVMGYMHNLAEFSADPIWVYMLNPKLAKSTMPKTTKLIQKFFNQTDGSPVKFFGHPLATLVAIALATLAAGKDEEEQQKTMQIPQGALSPQMGMLSA